MNIAITGGTGFIGKNVTELLVAEGHHVYILTRSPEKHQGTEYIHYVGWLSDRFKPEQALVDCDAIINLAGESLFGYWTTEKKERIISSRIKVTNRVIDLIKAMKKKPEVLINASAVGYYGTSTTEMFTEETTENGNDFLAKVTKQWEDTAKQASELGVRVVYARLGIVLGNEGTLPLMALPYKLFVGGKIGSGEQWISWVHVKDVAHIILFAIENSKINGPLNITAPKPVQQKVFSKHLAKKLRRPDWLPVPTFFLRTLLGEMSILVVNGQAVLPKKIEAHGYHHNYPDIEQALTAIYVPKSQK
ncbi:epimerase family protein YfhF [Paraliobacillus quinghaiensis]|uniref:Epimerase family protein YfhF n=1 Tax=Paraliobacillus quinghaiensis TaxID=470815 RepID=A0A917TN35_9BACI|nr:TIGR01777 family oxidoreductase [Paraliobacillus quinghaiensis]GGM29814.1 epimerase family protein YfhF [Paraliobacillus quinghaiensis]